MCIARIAYQGASADVHTSDGSSQNKGTLGLLKVLLGGMYQPEVGLDIHVKGAIPFVLVSVFVDAIQTAARDENVSSSSEKDGIPPK